MSNVLSSLQKKLSLPSGYILYIGNYKPHKNVPSLITAYKELPERLREGHHLVLAGYQGAYRAGTLEQLESLDISETAHILDVVPDSDLPALYAGASVFVLPSLHEGFGLPPLEAMSSGIPVIGDVNTLPEVVDNAGVLVDCRKPENIRNALEQLLTQPHVHRVYRQKGLKRARRFENERVATRILGHLERVASHRG